MKYICISIILIACVVANVFNRKKKFALYGFISVILISLLLEFTIFNVKSYRLDFSKNNKYDYNYNNLNENIMEYSDGTKYINISNIDDEIKTIYVEFENVKENEYIDYQIIYGDETTSRRGLPSKQYTPSVENTKYTAVFLSGKVKNLEIRYSSNEELFADPEVDVVIIAADIIIHKYFFHLTISITSFLHFIQLLCHLSFNKASSTVSQYLSVICQFFSVLEH